MTEAKNGGSLTLDSAIIQAEELIAHDELRAFYKERGVRCFGCLAAEKETFAQGANVHAGGPFGGFDAAQIVAGLNELVRAHPFDPAQAHRPTLLKRLVDLVFPSEE
jgi:hypothetical protein